MKKKIKFKECPKCKQKNLGLKVRTCPNKKCGHKFTFEKKIIGESKNCPDCNTKLKKKARVCYKCKYKYPKTIKKIKKFEPIEDWKKLKPGQSFFAKGGPYYILDTDGQTLKKGDRVEMGYYGKCIVNEVIKDGIKIFFEGGCGFLYMGPPKISETTGINMVAHKLYRKVI